MTSKQVDEYDEESKFRLDANSIRVAIEGTKYNTPFRCEKCGDPFIYESEVWGLVSKHDGINSPICTFVHYDCEVAKR